MIFVQHQELTEIWNEFDISQACVWQLVSSFNRIRNEQQISYVETCGTTILSPISETSM